MKAFLHTAALLLCGSPVLAAQSRYTLITAAGKIGTLTVAENGSSVDSEWRVDDNGRGSKLKEHAALGADGLPRRVEIEGKSWFGAPVKESFLVEGARAKWTSLDGSGEGQAQDALYLDNDGTPWDYALYLKILLSSKGLRHAALPGGTLRLEKLRDVEVGRPRDRLTAYALWGLDVAPTFLLARGDRLAAWLSPGYSVMTEQRHESDYAELSALGSSLSADALKRLAARLAHKVDGPVWLTNVRVFDPASGKLGEPTSVGVFRDRIVAMGEPAPADALVVDGEGGALLPGLVDAHDHLNDWAGPLHMAAGVTLSRDPGNDNNELLKLERRILDGEIMGPRLVKSGFLEGKSPYSAHTGFIVDSVDDAKAKVRWYADHGYWGIKIYNSMNPEFVRPIAEEAHRLGMHVSGHVPAFMSSERAVRDGYDEINHINQLLLSFIIDPLKDDTRTPFRFTALGERLGRLDLGSEPVRKMLALMKERKTALDPTLSVFSVLLQSRPGQASPAEAPWLDHMPVAMQRSHRKAALDIKPEQYPLYDASWKKLEEALVALYREGIPLVPGTDNTAGLMLHSELEGWVKAGIPASAALSMATLGAARFLGLESELGSVTRGKLADLYLVAGDPTRDIGAIRNGRLVIKDGRLYFPDEIYAALGAAPFAPHVAVRPGASRHEIVKPNR